MINHTKNHSLGIPIGNFGFGREGPGLADCWTFLDSTAPITIYSGGEFSCRPRIAETNPPTLARGKRSLALRKGFIQ